jgi:hypothetical protein
MKKPNINRYKSKDGTEIVEINYDKLHYDYYSSKWEGNKHYLLGSYMDRLEDRLRRHEWKRITKAQFDKIFEKFTNDSN